MKSATRFLPLLVFPAAALLMAANIGYQPSNSLTVHEWGTLTSVAGANGAPADWYALGCKSDLPTFVNDYGYRGFKFALRGTVRMETPVLYFYSQRELNANVKVSFPQGLITEWYPKADYKVFHKSTVGGVEEQLPANLNDIDTSLRTLTGTIEWRNVRVEPNTSPALPVDNGGNRYYAARETDSAPLTIGDQHEKFLFYRGVGRFPVPLLARVSEDGRVVVENERPRAGPRGNPVRESRREAGLSACRVFTEHDDPRFPVTRWLAAGIASQPGERACSRRDSFRKRPTRWSRPGAIPGLRRVRASIYVLPTSSVDAILPLQIDPAPLKRTRVFVGRIELITPETIRSVESAIAVERSGHVCPSRAFSRTDHGADSQ